jgi:hypothetical protein
MITDVTDSQIANAVSILGFGPITNTTIASTFAGVLPAGYTLSIQERGAQVSVRSWVVRGERPGMSPWRAHEPCAAGQGGRIIRDLIRQTIAHATANGHNGLTCAELSASVEGAVVQLTICPECQKAVQPGEIGSVAGYHRDCC